MAVRPLDLRGVVLSPLRIMASIVLLFCLSSPLQYEAGARSLMQKRFDQGDYFLLICRNRTVELKAYSEGFCIGFIESKLERLTKSQKEKITVEMPIYNDRCNVNYPTSVVLMDIIIKKVNLDLLLDRSIIGTKTSDAILDYIIDHLLYRECV